MIWSFSDISKIVCAKLSGTINIIPNGFTKYSITSCFSFLVVLQDGLFLLFPPTPTGWAHIVGNYDGESVKMFMDGAEVASSTTKGGGPYVAGDGRIVVGREYTDKDWNYASVEVDELTFFNRSLSSDEITSLATAT